MLAIVVAARDDSVLRTAGCPGSATAFAAKRLQDVRIGTIDLKSFIEIALGISSEDFEQK
jgi:hypothetical protein